MSKLLKSPTYFKKEYSITKTKKTRFSKYFGKNGIWLLMCAPMMLLTLLFSYIPIPGIVLAFKDYNFTNGIFGSEWVGFKNFDFFFKSQDFWMVTRNTVGLNLLFLFVGHFVALVFAIIMFEITKKSFLKLYQTIMFFPYFLSWVVVGYMLYAFLNMDLGIANRFLANFGIEPIAWYQEPKFWPYILVFISIWKSTGASCVIYYASIIGIDTEYYEAAALDGASKRQMAIHITIPSILPLVFLFLLLGIGQIFRADFGMFYILPRNSGILQSTTLVIDTYVYNMLRQLNDMGMGAAVGLYQSVVGFILILGSNMIVKKFSSENSLF